MAATALVAASPVLDVDRVRVGGAQRSGAVAVARATGVAVGDAMVAVQADRVAAGVERLAWVEDVSVRRSWPSTVVIDVEERRPMAAMATPAGAFAIVDGVGRILETTPAAPAGLIIVRGVPATGAPGSLLGSSARGALRLSAMLTADLAGRVASVDVDTEGLLTMGVRQPGGSEVRVLLGAPTRLDTKVLALDTLLTRAVPDGAATIDLRVPTAPVLTNVQPPT